MKLLGLLLIRSILSLLDISNYTRPDPHSTTVQYIAVLGTNDLHGAFYPEIVIDKDINKTYSYGGVEYLARYITILRNEFKNNFLWFDSGDIFEGSTESHLSKGSIINDFYNAMHLNAMTIGNHDWDEGQKFLIDFMANSHFPYVLSNIYNVSSGKDVFLPHQVKSKVFSMPNNITIGVIGITTVTTPNTTSGDLSEIEFTEYADAIVTEGKKMREQGVNAVVLIAHAGLKCLSDSIEKYENRIRTVKTPQGKCRKDDELYRLLNALPKKMIDLVIAGHLHDIVHHWINDIPVIASLSNGYYATVAYLPFDIRTKSLLKKEIAVEGPLPVCQKVFSSTKRCMPLFPNANGTKPDNKGDLFDFSFHNAQMTKETMLSGVAAKWKRQTNKATNSSLASLLKDHWLNEAYREKRGYFYSDVMIKATGADMSILPLDCSGDIWDEGRKDALITFEVNGRELILMMSRLFSNGFRAIPIIKGLKVYLTDDNNSVYNIKLYDAKYEKDILYTQTYTIASVDCVVSNESILKWSTPASIKQFNLLKEEIRQYLDYIDVIDLRDDLNTQAPSLKTLSKKPLII